MLARVLSAAVNGIEAFLGEVEVNSGWGDTLIVLILSIPPISTMSFLVPENAPVATYKSSELSWLDNASVFPQEGRGFLFNRVPRVVNLALDEGDDPLRSGNLVEEQIQGLDDMPQGHITTFRSLIVRLLHLKERVNNCARERRLV
jgi:hypothetical protein